MSTISELIGLTMKSVRVFDDEQLVFECEDGRQFSFYHSQDCCEHVSIESVVGDLNDLVGAPIVRADEETSEDDPQDYKRDYPPESVTWTFYKFATRKGYVDVRWLGESNGYYSESVSYGWTTA